MAAHAPMPIAEPHDHEDHAHPGADFYVRVAIALTIITAVEVVIYYIEGFRGFLVPALLVLSILKFLAVVAYFMHLKFDDKRFAWLFTAGLAISLSVMIAMVVMNHHGGYYAPVLLPPAE
jgi:cytochrome c oxidase subunit IV